MLCPISEEIENDYEQDVESELAQASAQLKEAVDELPELVESEDECESVGDELDANGEMERPLDAPVRLPEVPVQRFSSEMFVRAKALGALLGACCVRAHNSLNASARGAIYPDSRSNSERVR